MDIMKGAIGCIMLPFLLPIIAVAILIYVLYRRGKKQAWSGTIVEKIHNIKTEDDGPLHKVHHLYSVKVKIDSSGEVHAIALSKDMFDKFSEGDRLEKKSGESWPHKIS